MEVVGEVVIESKVEGAKQTQEDLENIQEEVKKTDKVSEEYNKTLKDSTRELKIMGVSLGGLQDGFKKTTGVLKNSITSLKGFKVALASTGIGLIVVALGTLAKALSENQVIMDKVEDVMTRLNAAWRETVELAGNLYAIWTQLTDGTISLAEAWDKAKDAAIEWREEAQKAGDEGVKQNKIMRELDAEVRKYVLTNAQLNKELAEVKRNGEDVSLNIQKRIDDTRRAIEIIELQGQKEVDFARRRLEIEEARIANIEDSNRRDEEQLKLLELRAAVVDAEAQAIERTIEFQNKLNPLLQERNKLNQRDLITLQSKTATIQQNSSLELEALDRLEAKQRQVFRDQIAGEQATQSATLGSIQAKILQGIAATFGSAPFPISVALVALAQGFAQSLFSSIQSRIIKATSIPQFAEGGYIPGRLHSQGGTIVEAERGEYIVNRGTMRVPWMARQIEHLNAIGNTLPKYQDGGYIPEQFNTSSTIVPVLVTEDLHDVENRVLVTDSSSTL